MLIKKTEKRKEKKKRREEKEKDIDIFLYKKKKKRLFCCEMRDSSLFIEAFYQRFYLRIIKY
jgi:hypothetical protein